MNTNYRLVAGLVVLTICFSSSNQVYSQAFKKGSLLVSISEGTTTANYSTRDINKPRTTELYSSDLDGERDPLIIEFGLTNKWGIGLSSGADIFEVNPARYYGFKLADNEPIKVKTSELTLDLNYHYLVNKKLDLSAFSSIGLFSIDFNGKSGDSKYNHKSEGAIIRVGTKAKYYFYKRLGVMGMFSLYSGTASPKGIKDNNVGTNISTNLAGRALEFGLCFRFF